MKIHYDKASGGSCPWIVLVADEMEREGKVEEEDVYQ